MMAMSVVMMWKTRFEVGTFHDRSVNRPEVPSMMAKMTHRVRCPASPAVSWMVGLAVGCQYVRTDVEWIRSLCTE